MHTNQSKSPGDEALERFVELNRDAFDDEVPPSFIWDGVNDALDQQQPVRVRSLNTDPIPSQNLPRSGSKVTRFFSLYSRQLAAACAILAVGLIGGYLMNNQNRDEPLQPEQQSDVIVEVENLERAFQEAIDSRFARVASLNNDPKLSRDLREMATPELKASEKLTEVAPGSERAVIKAMVTEYKAKLEALEHVLERLEAAEQKTKLSPREQTPAPRRNKRPVQEL